MSPVYSVTLTRRTHAQRDQEFLHYRVDQRVAFVVEVLTVLEQITLHLSVCVEYWRVHIEVFEARISLGLRLGKFVEPVNRGRLRRVRESGVGRMLHAQEC